MNWADWAVLLPGIVFLFTVIDPLPVRRRERISGVITWLWFAVLLFALLTSGVQFGLLAGIIGSFTLGCLMRPLGKALGERMYRDETDGGLTLSVQGVQGSTPKRDHARVAERAGETAHLTTSQSDGTGRRAGLKSPGEKVTQSALAGPYAGSRRST
jgi:hypothetical protein